MTVDSHHQSAAEMWISSAQRGGFLMRQQKKRNTDSELVSESFYSGSRKRDSKPSPTINPVTHTHTEAHSNTKRQ